MFTRNAVRTTALSLSVLIVAAPAARATENASLPALPETEHFTIDPVVDGVLVAGGIGFAEMLSLILSTGEMTWDAGASNAVPPPAAATASVSHAEAESSPFRKR